MKRICFPAVLALMTALTAGSCSQEQSTCGYGDDGSVIPVTFTMSTPAGEVVPYGATRALPAVHHDAAEWTIHNLSLYVYSVDDQGEGTFLRSYSTEGEGDRRISIVSNGAGTYTFTLRAPVNDLLSRQRFIFVANDSFADPKVGDPQSDLQTKLATIGLQDNDPADALAPSATGMVMSGIAQSSSNDIITIKPGVKCEVHLKRIVARIDVQNNTPNLVITSMELENAASQGYLFEQKSIAAAGQGFVTEAMNANVTLGTSYDEQTNLAKAFYLYERPNTSEDGIKVKISYRINNTNGAVEVPFQKTDTKDYVDVVRNTLYTIVLGDGTSVVTNEVKFTFKVEDWNVVDMDEAISPDADEQRRLNAALKVNMFTPYNVKSLDPVSKEVTFYDQLLPSQDYLETSYFVYNWLAGSGSSSSSTTLAAGADDDNTNTVDLRNATLYDAAGNEYRIPTAGEFMLLLPALYSQGSECYYPQWNDNPVINTIGAAMIDSPFDETIYLENDDNFDLNQSGATVTGQTQLMRGARTDVVQWYYGEQSDLQQADWYIHPVYGIRFKGSSEYAAYRWESCRLADDPMERYFSIKIKALPQNSNITIDDVARESYWKDGFIEFKIPAMGRIDASDVFSRRGVEGYIQSSTRNHGLIFGLGNAHITNAASLINKRALRLVKK